MNLYLLSLLGQPYSYDYKMWLYLEEFVLITKFMFLRRVTYKWEAVKFIIIINILIHTLQGKKDHSQACISIIYDVNDT